MRIENSFIPVRGVGETTERKLWQQGITRWEEFERDAVGETTGERIESFIETARARLDANDARFFDDAFPNKHQWRLYENFRNDACFFDIETTGLSQSTDEVTTVSVHQDDTTRTFVNDASPVIGESLTPEKIRATIGEAPLLVTFNGKRFDVPFLETALDIEIDGPHIDLMYPCRQLDLTGGLKRIEQTVGIDRDQPDITGRDAVRLWREYERGDADALTTLVSYNRDDTVNLRRLMDHVAETLHDDVFASVC
ncbi:ribonuclease H-like domain-containing protein [Halocatena pleomorpha]|uniref:Exonuclease n=1 Tax=Halocatena pleomorpha TaxID=1785090 RepID=A0A3P3R2M2_9EURY|nr:ribonuclease H-like domain-containing protein [Halocatena pleomorpha]RRJ27574.1 exonuclease [Halocatena pleomorpha]